MSDLTIWDRLAKLDPALTEQQRCEHEWVADPNDHAIGVRRHVCRKCRAVYTEGKMPLVGDGRNEERYDRLDALAGNDGLTRRLGLLAVLELYPIALTVASVARCDEEPLRWHKAKDDDICLALGTAILEAMEVPADAQVR